MTTADLQHMEHRPSPDRGAGLMELLECPGLFADAVVTDPVENLLFVSLWGRDTAVQALLARLSLREGGLSDLCLDSEACGRRCIQVGNPDRLDKLTGRMPKGNLFGDVAHLWLYDRLVCTPDRANRRAVMLYRPAEAAAEGAACVRSRLWQLVRETCHLPLLPHWQEAVLTVFEQQGWLCWLTGIGMSAVAVDLGADAVDDALAKLIRTGAIGLAPEIRAL